MGGRANPVVTRFYRESSEADSCTQAVQLLLDFTERKQRAIRRGGPDDAKKSSNESKASGATHIVKNRATDADVLPNLRELFSKHPEAAAFGPEALTGLLYGTHCVTRRPEVFEVEAALAALAVEGEVVP